MVLNADEVTYLITFYSHYDAIKMRKEMAKCGHEVRLQSVPRVLSSSCGTAGVVSCELSLLLPFHPEGVYEVTNQGYRRVEWSN